MPTPYRYKLKDCPAFPDFIADVLEATDARKHSMDLGVRSQMYRDALCAIQSDMAANCDDAMNKFAERHFNLGQS
jgi:hypothetical protein